MSISRVYRLLRLVTILQSGRSYTADQLADELQVSRRTVFRDLNMLELAHIPYYFDKDKGGYGISKHFFLPPVNLTLTEALAMLTMTGRLKNADRLPLLQHGASAAMKVQSVLPETVRKYVGEIINRLSLNIGPIARHEGLESIFSNLSEAVVAQTVCKIVYLSFYDKKQLNLTVHPLRLAFISRAWYLIAFSPKFGQVRTFKLTRIKKLTVTDKAFKPPKDFDLDRHLGSAWSMIPEGKLYNVHLRFAPKVAGNVAEVQWHHSQQVSWNDDGAIDFKAKVDGLGEILWWILGYGDQVEVLAPALLRKRLGNMAQSMAAKYNQVGK